MQNEAFWRWLNTAAVLLAMMNAGILQGIFGTTFPDLAILMSVTNGQIATTLTWTGLSSIVGTICVGPLFDRFDGLLLLSCGLMLQGLALGVAPWCRILVVYQFIVAISSLFSSGVLTGCLCVNTVIWKKKPEMLNSIIQLTLLTFELGTAITPQFIRPFVGAHQLPHIINLTTMANASDVSICIENTNFDAVTSNSTTGNFSGGCERPEPVQIAYCLVASINLLTGIIVFFVMCAWKRRQTKIKSYEYKVNRIARSRSCSFNENGRTVVDEEFTEESARERTASLDRMALQKKLKNGLTGHGGPSKPYKCTLSLEGRTLQRKELNRRNDVDASEVANGNPHGHAAIGDTLPSVTCSRNVFLLVVIVILFLTLAGGLEAMTIGLLYTFLNGYLHWTPEDGTLLVTIYFVTLLALHAVVILLARFISPNVILVVDAIFLLVSSVLMLVTVNARPVFTVIAVILTAIPESNIQASIITFAQRYFQVNGKVMGVFICAISLGFSVVSPIVGLLLDSYGVISFPVVLLSIAALIIVLLALGLVVAITARRGQDETPAEEIVVQNERTPLIGH